MIANSSGKEKIEAPAIIPPMYAPAKQRMLVMGRIDSTSAIVFMNFRFILYPPCHFRLAEMEM